jgi:hypothetical protein
VLAHERSAAGGDLVRGLGGVTLGSTLVDSAAERTALLDHMCQLVRKQPSAFGRLGRELPFSKHNVLAKSERARMDGFGGIVRVLAGMDSHVAEAFAEVRLHQLTGVLVETLRAVRVTDKIGRLLEFGQIGQSLPGGLCACVGYHGTGSPISVVFERIDGLADPPLTLQLTRPHHCD